MPVNEAQNRGIFQINNPNFLPPFLVLIKCGCVHTALSTRRVLCLVFRIFFFILRVFYYYVSQRNSVLKSQKELEKYCNNQSIRKYKNRGVKGNLNS